MTARRFAIVGGGIIGTAVAREVLVRLPDANVTIFEKEAKLAEHQTGHNSGVVHAGLYYVPGSLKASLCRRGVGLLKQFCDAKGLAYQECGKIVVAQNDTELQRLRRIFDRAVANGVPGVSMVDIGRMREIEPASRGLAALHSPHTAIVDYAGVTRALAADVEAAGGRVLLGQRVTGIKPGGKAVTVSTPELTEEFDAVITCAGLQSDRVSRGRAMRGRRGWCHSSVTTCCSSQRSGTWSAG
jgi:L-2-hydroxyglutarate oxidase LhgO